MHNCNIIIIIIIRAVYILLQEKIGRFCHFLKFLSYSQRMRGEKHLSEVILGRPITEDLINKIMF